MAPSNKCSLLILFLVGFTLTPNLAAIKGEGTATAPSPAADGEALHPDQAELSIPDLPIPALLPCPPLFPKIPLIPCYEAPSPPPPPPEVTECRSSLNNMTPCAGFLTDSSVFAPSSECCAALDPFAEDAAVLPCLCHLTNGDIAQLLPAPLQHKRIVALLIACDFQITPNALSDPCSTLKDHIPPMDLASLPPSA